MDKGPRPYHAATEAAPRRPIVAAPAEWTEPKYPGDSIMRCDLRKGDDLGSVRVQWYADDKLKVGSFVPGVEQDLPGDTLKVWPEREDWCSDKDSAAREFVQHLVRAFRDGWRVWTCSAG